MCLNLFLILGFPGHFEFAQAHEKDLLLTAKPQVIAINIEARSFLSNRFKRHISLSLSVLLLFLFLFLLFILQYGWKGSNCRYHEVWIILILVLLSV